MYIYIYMHTHKTTHMYKYTHIPGARARVKPFSSQNEICIHNRNVMIWTVDITAHLLCV